jgi:hypothetical protein
MKNQRTSFGSVAISHTNTINSKGVSEMSTALFLEKPTI